MQVLTAPPSPAAEVSRRSWSVGGIDAVLVGLVLAFAFLAASFAARNSDLWLHLASGRLLAEGGYPFGVDPFAYTTTGVYWANHAWLSDLALYAGYRGLGGAGLVALKAALVAALAGVMLLSARRSGPVWVAAGCVLLAVLAMSPRLLLQPACASLLLLAVCLRLLRVGGRAVYAVPAVVVLWVNLDAWFLLGPLLVALFGVGRLVAPRDAAPRHPLWLLPASLAACLVSPYHVHGLTLPPELSPAVWGSALRHDPQFAGLFASPWRLAALGSAGGYNLAAWAFFALLALGVVSFAVNRRAARGWRGVVWLAFALLAAWQVRLVPFFAVVAGPITALNLGDVWPRDFLGRVGRGGLLAAGVALLAVAWAGWLQGFRGNERAVSWAVLADPSLERAARTLADWRRDNLLPPGARTFTTHPDVAHYLTWFCPGEKVFLDSRFPLFTPVAAEYAALCQSLGLTAEKGDDSDPARRAIRAHDIGCVVLYDPSPGRLVGGLREVSRSPDRWAVLRVEGLAVLVGVSAEPSDRPNVPRFDPDDTVFAAPSRSVLPPTPPAGPPRLAQPVEWWNPTTIRPGAAGAWEADAAIVYLQLFEVNAKPNASPALPLLAARAARVALAANPDDAGAWLALARAYLLAGRATWEADAALPPLAELRRVQVAAALTQALTRNPDSLPAHDMLAGLFGERQFLDLALRHRQAQLRLARQAGPLPGEAAEAFADRLARLAEVADQIEAAVQDNENRFIVRSQALAGDPLARARLAVQLGLPGKALDGVLLKSHPDLYGVDGLRLLLELLLATGRVEEAGDLLDREELKRNPTALGFHDVPGGSRDGRPWGYRFPAYDWFDLCRSAAVGRYEQADAALDRLRDRARREDEQLRPVMTRGLAWRVAAEAGLDAAPAAVLSRLYAAEDRNQQARRATQVRFLLVERADLDAMLGLLRLERGEPASAAGSFQSAASLYEQANDKILPTPGRSLTTHALRALRPPGK